MLAKLLILVKKYFTYEKVTSFRISHRRAVLFLQLMSKVVFKGRVNSTVKCCIAQKGFVWV